MSPNVWSFLEGFLKGDEKTRPDQGKVCWWSACSQGGKKEMRDAGEGTWK